MQKTVKSGRLDAFSMTKEEFLMMQNNKKKAACATMLCMAMALPFGANAEN